MTMQTIAVADFGVGNLHSVVGALQRAAKDAKIILAKDARAMARADKIILPGDGHFDACMRAINNLGMVEVLMSAAEHKPFWGICAGMQMLYEGSEEGQEQGLGIFNGRIRKLPKANNNNKIPHIGWNTTTITQPQNPMLRGVADGARFYFIHSYYATPDKTTAATTTHNTTIAAICAKDNIFATQFHPEKSATPGEQLIKNFINL